MRAAQVSHNFYLLEGFPFLLFRFCNRRPSLTIRPTLAIQDSLDEVALIHSLPFICRQMLQAEPIRRHPPVEAVD